MKVKTRSVKTYIAIDGEEFSSLEEAELHNQKPEVAAKAQAIQAFETDIASFWVYPGGTVPKYTQPSNAAGVLLKNIDEIERAFQRYRAAETRIKTQQGLGSASVE